jgi:phosphomecalonate degydratase small subunit
MQSRPDRPLVFRGRPGVGDPVEGEALVSAHGFSARYDLNRRTGLFSREAHDLFGQSVVGKVLLFPTAKGGVATAWALLDLRERGLSPAGLVFGEANPIMVQGAVLANLALLHRLSPDPLASIRSGDRVRLVPAEGRLEILRRP